MMYARMGDSGLIVSRLSFGAMTFTLANRAMESVYKVGEDLAREMVALETLDAAMPPPRVYPNWFTEATTDQAHRDALGEGTAR